MQDTLQYNSADVRSQFNFWTTGHHRAKVPRSVAASRLWSLRVSFELILTVWKGKFWQFGKGNFDSLEREILTVWKVKFWQFEKGNFDSLKREILTVWKVKFWQFEKGNFDSLEREILDSLKKGNFDCLEREILTVWKGKFWQFEKGKFWQFGKGNFDSYCDTQIEKRRTILSVSTYLLSTRLASHDLWPAISLETWEYYQSMTHFFQFHFRSSECDVVRGECTQTYVPYLFLVIPLGPVTLTGKLVIIWLEN
jgi:hypothetical protein